MDEKLKNSKFSLRLNIICQILIFNLKLLQYKKISIIKLKISFNLIKNSNLLNFVKLFFMQKPYKSKFKCKIFLFNIQKFKYFYANFKIF